MVKRGDILGYNVRVENLSFAYEKNEILNNINFSVKSGDFIAIVGASGAGKSTLLKCINRLNEASGQIYIENEDIVKLSKKELRKQRRKIAFIFQDYNVLDNLYTIDNVLTPYLAYKNVFSLLKGYSKDEYNKAYNYLEKVGLEKEAFKKTKYLSGGQKQRVSIAKALCQNPKLLLADEPISSLDEKNSESIMNIFSGLNEDGLTILINLHDVNIAKKYCNKILGLKNGKVQFFKEIERVSADEFKQLYN